MLILQKMCKKFEQFVPIKKRTFQRIWVKNNCYCSNQSCSSDNLESNKKVLCKFFGIHTPNMFDQGEGGTGDIAREHPYQNTFVSEFKLSICKDI